MKKHARKKKASKQRSLLSYPVFILSAIVLIVGFIIFLYISFSTPKVKCGGNVLGAVNNAPWGGMYVPIDEAVRYKMDGVITNNHTRPNGSNSLSEFLQTARENNIKVIITLGPMAECNYYTSDTVFNYNSALADARRHIDTMIQQLGISTFQSYVADGTITALRIFDEVHYAGSCVGNRGIPYVLERCDEYGRIVTRTLNGLPIGTDSSPGFADMLHELKKDSRIPERLVLGSTSVPSYMYQVVLRINLLRQREGLSPLGDNSVLAYDGIGRNIGISAQQYYECGSQNLRGSNYIYYLANRTAEYQPDNYIWFQDYIGACTASGVDFVTSWSWEQGTAGTFRSRMESLANNLVSQGGDTLTLSELQSFCGNSGNTIPVPATNPPPTPAPTPPPSPTPPPDTEPPPAPVPTPTTNEAPSFDGTISSLKLRPGQTKGVNISINDPEGDSFTISYNGPDWGTVYTVRNRNVLGLCVPREVSKGSQYVITLTAADSKGAYSTHYIQLTIK